VAVVFTKINKMIKLDFLDVLYTWKVVAEQRLEKLIEEKEQVTKSTEHLDVLRELEIKHAEEVVNRYRTTISSYMAHHNCH
jgi:RNase P subunit RPR2